MKPTVIAHTAELYKTATPMVSASDTGPVAAVVTEQDTAPLFLSTATAPTRQQTETLLDAIPTDAVAEVIAWRSTEETIPTLLQLGAIVSARRVSTLLPDGTVLYLWPVRSKASPTGLHAPVDADPGGDAPTEHERDVAIRDGEHFTTHEVPFLRAVLAGEVTADASTALWAVISISNTSDALAIARELRDQGTLDVTVLNAGLRYAPDKHKATTLALMNGVRPSS